jgi:hypothetical protein
MNFNQWKGYAAKKDVAKVTYVCGNQSALVEIVVKDIIDILKPPVTDFVNVYATDTMNIWELASQYSLNPETNRLVVVRDAEKITNWNGLEDWLANSRVNPKNHIVFVANTDDAPAIFSKGKRVSYAEHIDVIRTKGKFIKCSMPSHEDLISWAQSYGLSKESAEFLIERTSGDTGNMLNVLRKIHVFKASPNVKAINLLCDEQFLSSFTTYLIEGDKYGAYQSLQNLSEDGRLKALTELDYTLNYVYEIGNCVRKRMYDVDIAAKTGIKIFLVKKFRPVVKDYDEKKIKHCRQLLAMTDSALRQGAKTGVMEGLITLW